MAEIRTMSEGAVWWVQASGSGNAWATASAPASGLYGFVRSFTFTSGQTVQTVMDRGVPNHQKITSKQPISVNLNFAWTGTHPTAASGAGASVPMFHLEYKADRPEASASAYYFQFFGAAQQSNQFSEGEQEDTIQQSWVALGMNGPTGSGYLVAP